jgi:aspartokinase-like uncharacterized kinase
MIAPASAPTDRHSVNSRAPHAAANGIGGDPGANVAVDVVLKVGGALVRDLDAFDRAATELGRLRRDARILLVPGGGPFADAVRDVDRLLQLGDDTAHWMAILAMDQYAHVLGARIPRAVVVEDPADLDTACNAGCIPVLAPYRWLRRADPLPHSWQVTSDSIAAWIAIALRATYFVLLKPVSAPLRDVTDAHCASVLAVAATGAPLVRLCTARDVVPVIASLAIPAAGRDLPD